jgi:16S rRNA (guanine527-N7)-methyltransferase
VTASLDDVPLERLRAGTRSLGLGLPEPALRRCLAYLHELARWNRVYSLTAVRSIEEMLPRHLLDSLAVLPWVAGSRVVDAGSGAGLPGIPLAIARPAAGFTLVDASAKKTRFLRHVTGVLGLSNVGVEQARLEDYQPAAGFDTVVARALAPLPRLLALVGHLGSPGGRVLALKGRRPDAELEALPPGWEVVSVARLAGGSLLRSDRLPRAGTE